MNWIQPVIDRTQSDIDYAIFIIGKIRSGNYTQDEFYIWNNGLKGCWNLSDTERISTNIKFLGSFLKIELPELELVEIPTESWFNELTNILGILKSSYSTNDITENIPEQPITTYDKLNTVENILFEIHRIITNKVFHYCGENYYCGDSLGMLL